MTRAKIIKINPEINIAHFVNFLKPRSLDTWNKSRSLEPIRAPEKEFECGDIKNDINIINIATITSKITITVVIIIEIKL